MSDWNSTENRLRSWLPRQPSPEIRQNLFARDGSTAAWRLPDLVRWAVPALGCFLLAAASLNTRHSVDLTLAATNQIHPPSGRSSEPPTLVLAASAHDHHSGVNSVPCQNVEWVLGARASAARPATLLISDTNTLIH